MKTKAFLLADAISGSSVLMIAVSLFCLTTFKTLTLEDIAYKKVIDSKKLLLASQLVKKSKKEDKIAIQFTDYKGNKITVVLQKK